MQCADENFKKRHMRGIKIPLIFHIGVHSAQFPPVLLVKSLVVNMLALLRGRCYTLLLQPL